jgi:glycosyltransferase involved in cell wall biosynthesis
MTPPQSQRILMTTDAVGGVWTYAAELARALCGSGCEVTLVVMGPPPRPDQLDPLHGCRGLRIEITDLALEWMDPEGSDIQRAREFLLRVADRAQPHLTHLNSYREASFDWPSPVLVVAHSCVLSWWRACHGGTPADARWQRYATAVASGLIAADVWVAPTAAFRDVIEAVYRPDTAGRVIWNGIGQRSPGSASKRPYVLAAGRLWDDAKNLAGLARIAPELDWPVRVAGPAREPDAITKEAAFNGVECLGLLAQPALAAEMRRAGIFASPAVYEPFGLTVLEAAASGCALALSDIPSFRELWSDAALFFDPRDDNALLNALQILSRDGRLRNTMQGAAWVRARRYSIEAMAGAYLDLYRTIAASAQVRSAPRSTATLELRA